MTRSPRALLWAIGVTAVVSACGSPASDSVVETGATVEPPSISSRDRPSSAGAPFPGLGGMAPQTGGSRPAGPPAVAGGPRENSYLRLEVTEAGFWPDRAAPSGLRYYTVGLRGTSRSESAQLLGRSKGDDMILDVRRFVFAQDERGCISRPERDVTGVANLIGDSITFPRSGHVEGRLVFLVPDDTKQIRVLVAPAGEGLIVPAGPDFTPAWPTPIHTIDDGSLMRVHVLPIAPAPAALPPPGAGRELVVVDVAVENSSATQGVEFQTSQQLRLVDAGGRFIQLSPLTERLACRLADGDVIPPGHTRRLQAVYDMPAGAPRRLQYRGFEKDQATVEIK